MNSRGGTHILEFYGSNGTFLFWFWFTKIWNLKNCIDPSIRMQKTIEAEDMIAS